MFGIGVATAALDQPPGGLDGLRWLSVAAMPAVLLALYFTYSRGGLLALVVASGCLIALSRDRLWLLGDAGDRRARRAAGGARRAGAPQPRRKPRQPGGGRPGRHGAADPAAGIAARAGALRRAARAERREGRLTGRALRVSRNPTGAAGHRPRAAPCSRSASRSPSAAAPGTSSPAPTSSSPNQPAAALPELSAAPVATTSAGSRSTAFGEKPVLGHGAGTYQFSWDQLRSIELPRPRRPLALPGGVRRARAVGGLLVLALVGIAALVGFAAWRAAPEPQRERYAACSPQCSPSRSAPRFDWFWEIAGAGRDLLPRRRRRGRGPLRPARRRPGRDRRAARSAASASPSPAWRSPGSRRSPWSARCWSTARSTPARAPRPTATSPAPSTTPSTARSIEPWAASPYVQLGLLAERRATTRPRSNTSRNAIDREDDNWQWYYLRSRVEHEARRPGRGQGRPRTGPRPEPTGEVPAEAG